MFKARIDCTNWHLRRLSPCQNSQSRMTDVSRHSAELLSFETGEKGGIGCDIRRVMRVIRVIRVIPQRFRAICWASDLGVL